MIPFHDRTSLILWLGQALTDRSIKRALWEGKVRVLGGFSHIPPGTSPGWIVEVASGLTDYVWVLAIICNEHRREFPVSRLKPEDIPWKHYSGILNRGGYSVYDGDDPGYCEEMKCQNQDT